MGGVENTQDFMRIFMVSGMYHCEGGPGCSSFDALGALEQWVEQGVAPDKIDAVHLTDGKADLARPLLPVPTSREVQRQRRHRRRGEFRLHESAAITATVIAQQPCQPEC